MKKAAALAFVTLTFPLLGQQIVRIPSLAITGSTIDSTCSFDPNRKIYRYEYSIAAAQSNKADVGCFSIELTGITRHTQVDPDLHENITRDDLQLQPPTTIPVGVTVPDPSHTLAVLGKKGFLGVCAHAGTWEVKPGTRASGFIIESKFPPGLRKAVLQPSTLAWMKAQTAAGKDDDFEAADAAPDYEIATVLIAPAEYAESNLYSGGGEQPADVERLIRFAAPLDNRVKVAANSTQKIIVLYGASIDPATFSADQDGIDIRSRFQPYPGVADVVDIAVGTATTRLHLSVVGTSASGGKRTDSDTITFLPQ